MHLCTGLVANYGCRCVQGLRVLLVDDEQSLPVVTAQLQQHALQYSGKRIKACSRKLTIFPAPIMH